MQSKNWDGSWLKGGEVEPFVGFGPIVFGMKRREVLAAMGVPESKERTSFPDGSTNVNWEYSQAGVELSFSSEYGYRLGTITFTRPEFTLRGVKVVGIAETALVRKVEQGVLPAFVLTDRYPFMSATNYDFDEEGLNLWCNDGVVENLTLFVRYDPSGRWPQWPLGRKKASRANRSSPGRR